MRLITIRLSHFNERARWALDRFRVPYQEEAYMPLLHVPAVFLATRGRGGRAERHSTRYSTPVLVLDDGRCLCDSGDIVRWVDERFSTPEPVLPAPVRDGAAGALSDGRGVVVRRVWPASPLGAGVLDVPSLCGSAPMRSADYGRKCRS